MTNIIKISSILSVLMFAVFAFGVFSSTAFAWGTGDYGDGCCTYSQSSYYGQSSYYSQGSYYSQSTYATPASCDLFTGTPTTLPYGGGNVTLNWATTNATEVSINQGVGAVSDDGSKTVAVTGDITFKLTAKGTGGNDDCTVSINVADMDAPSCDSFTGSPTTLPYGGGNVALNWATTNATDVSINQGVGSVSADGSKVVNVTDSKTFVLTASNVKGSKTCSVPVTVQPNSAFSCDSFNIDKSQVEKGESFTMTWETTNADSVSINQGIGSVNADGSYTTSTQEDKTYTLTVTKGNETKTCSDNVTIKTNTYSQGSYNTYSQGSYGGGSSSPKCEIDISAKKIKKGKEVVISWESTRATEIVLKDNHGKTLIDTDDLSSKDKKEFYDGEIKVRPTKDTTYTLTASKGSKDRTCKVSVDVESEIVVLETRDQKPTVKGISLTQVPYTGFEAGPALTFIFYGLLTLWALFVAYVFIVKKKVS